MSQKQHFLHELLKEDQEPFLLNSFISDRRSQMNKPSLQAKKRKPMFNQTSNFPVNLCRKSCLFSFPETTTTPKKSPLFDPKSPCKSPNAIFLHIPSRTAALLLEAALRIQKQSSPTSKPKTRGFGLFGSLFKRLTQRNKGGGDSVKWDSCRKLCNGRTEEKVEVGFLCSYNGRTSSAVWSESNEEDKSLDMETSCSGHSDDDNDCERVHFVTDECGGYCCHHHRAFCESPFRFALQTSPSPSSGHHTPELLSPSHHKVEDKENNGGESLKEFKSGEEEEEDKEQCSPVSVLDPPFEDDDEGHGNNHENDHDHDHDHDDFDMESSYAIVQRAKEQLLYKLCRFEKLAGLDPVELEKRMLEQEEEEAETLMEDDDHEGEDREASYEENDFRDIVLQAVCQLRVHDRDQNLQEFKKLVLDLIVEEERGLVNSLEDRDLLVRKICKRLELWKEVESNTIDMMIEDDYNREDVGWKKNVEQIGIMAREVELAIFGFLVQEFSEELIC